MGGLNLAEVRFDADVAYVCEDDPGEPGMNGAKRGSITTREASLLSHAAKGLRVLEIGTGLGISTRALAETASLVVSLDRDPWVREHVWASLSEFTNLVLVIGRPQALGPPFDIAFVDGAHDVDSAELDFRYAIAHARRVIAHDTHFAGVAAAIDRLRLKTEPYGTALHMAVIR